jgi:hypothetical protein
MARGWFCDCERWLSGAGRFGVRDGCADILLFSEDGRLGLRVQMSGESSSSSSVSEHKGDQIRAMPASCAGVEESGSPRLLDGTLAVRKIQVEFPTYGEG